MLGREDAGPRFVDRFPHSQGSRRYCWLGPVSFEVRCSGSLAALTTTDCVVSKCQVFDYLTKAGPEEEDKARRRDSISEIERYARELGAVLAHKGEVSAYAGAGFQRIISSALRALEVDEGLVIDISCLTKIHTVMLASVLAGLDRKDSVMLAYTLPENFLHMAGESVFFEGWDDIIVAPISDTEDARLGNESEARGVIITGHEGHRLSVALNEIEAASYRIITGVIPERPDFERVTRRHNREVYRSLVASPQAEAKVDFRAAGEVFEFVRAEILRAEQSSAPVYLYPFGTKSVVLAAALACSVLYPLRSWFVYPIPSSYDVRYTEGTWKTHWLPGESVKAMLARNP